MWCLKPSNPRLLTPECEIDAEIDLEGHYTPQAVSHPKEWFFRPSGNMTP